MSSAECNNLCRVARRELERLFEAGVERAQFYNEMKASMPSEHAMSSMAWHLLNHAIEEKHASMLFKDTALAGSLLLVATMILEARDPLQPHAPSQN